MAIYTKSVGELGTKRITYAVDKPHFRPLAGVLGRVGDHVQVL